jgi:hypothetical protein
VTIRDSSCQQTAAALCVRRVEIGSPQRQHDEQKMAELTMLAALMLERADEITETVVTRVYQQFPIYAGMVRRELLSESVHDHVVSAFDPMARSQKADLAPPAPRAAWEPPTAYR